MGNSIPKYPNKHIATADETQQFRDAVNNITAPLQCSQVATVAMQQISNFVACEYLAAMAGEEKISILASGVSYKNFQPFRQGLHVEKIDLHNNTIAAAGTYLAHSIDDCYARSIRRLLIVHGKNGANGSIIKAHVAHWLRQSQLVLAAMSAEPQHGGTGACYVILKKLNH